jgi:hypothetical protein
VAAARAPYKLAVTDRDAAFKGLRALAVRSRNLLKASGAPKGVIEDAETYIRKLSGGRKSAKIKDDPNTPEDESKASSSASQVSYDNQIGNKYRIRVVPAQAVTLSPVWLSSPSSNSWYAGCS